MLAGMRVSLRLRRFLNRLALFATALFASSPALAHPVPFSYLDLRLRPGGLEGTLVAHVEDLGHDLGIEPVSRLLDPALASRQEEAIARLFAERLIFTVDGRRVVPQWGGVEVLVPLRQSLRLRFTVGRDSPPAVVSVEGALFPYDPVHRTFVNVYEGDVLSQGIIDADHPSFVHYTGTRQGRSAVVRRFFPSGIEHILIGPDHVLFLIGLLLTGGSMRRLVLIVTAFTLAHTITLTLAVLNLVSPPSSIIEPLIALSIVYVGADNLLRKEGRDTRAWIAFAFGFIHGFGFAYVLREMDLPAKALGWSLVSFNLGVEVGQLLIVTVVASALAALRSRHPGAARRVMVIGSVGVIAAGAFWYIQRLFFPGGIS
jgi:hydrogenase/urease accessory protein HupE